MGEAKEKKSNEVVQIFVGISLEKIISPAFDAAFSKLCRLTTLKGHDTFKIKRMKEKNKKEIAFYNEARTEALLSLTNRDDKGEPVIVQDAVTKIQHYDLTPENTVAFDVKHKELLAEKVEFATIKYSDLGENHGITPDDLLELDFIVE